MSTEVRDGPTQLRRLRRFALGALVVAAVVAGWGVFTRLQARAALQRAADENAVPVVEVVQPQRSAQADALTLPASVQAYSDAAIYARTNGYLRKWYVDIGASVKAGQLLADIDTPDVDAQLRQARADLATATAASRLATTTAERWQRLLASGTVARQDVDEKSAEAEARRTAADSARENVHRLEELESFKRVVAPFDGTVTARRTDVGQLITSGGGQELFHVAATHRLRVYVQVPQQYVDIVRPGMATELRPLDQPQSIPAIVRNTSRSLDSSTRSLLVELSVDPGSGLLPGAYVEVRFPVPASHAALHLPANVLLVRDQGTAVATVDAQGIVTIRDVRLGRDLGSQLEIVDGVSEQDRVVLNPLDSLTTGTKVRIRRTDGGGKQP